ncbi:hypothetical protein PTKIN_Ptkin17bG0036900 [Pterospermum kingtungense]
MHLMLWGMLAIFAMKEICNTKTQGAGFVYCCSPCKFVVHIECVSPSPIIEDKSHQHPFTLIWRQSSFICDACGTEGNYVAYVCCTCSIIVHKKCISLPRVIKSKWHDHRIFHTYFLLEEDFESASDCVICHDEVNLEHGSYFCSDCKIIFHVNCVTNEKGSYFVVSTETEDEKSSKSLELLPDTTIESITCVIERNSGGEATKVKHCKHIHDLIMTDQIAKYDHKCCDGCTLPVLDSFYHCSQCDFFLHKACAELPKMKHVWHHSCPQPLILVSDDIFRCGICGEVSNGFGYKCDECYDHTCFLCVIALTPGAQTSQGHEHPLFFYPTYEGQCSACGDEIKGAFRCKDCNFALDWVCIRLPTIARHKCDEHLLALTYHDDNNYLKHHYCDICEKKRDPNRWFFHCANCDTCAHVKCVLGKYPCIKLGSIYKKRDHPHPLTFVKKSYYYPKCIKCDEPCEYLALECAESRCNYIVHWECVASHQLKSRSLPQENRVWS